MSTNNKLAGKVAVVTGADKVVVEITSAGGKAAAVQGNVAKKTDIQQLFAETKKEFGRVDILVNNAGIYEFAPLEQITKEHSRKQFDLNVLGVLLTTQEALKYFPSAGGSIVNASSLVSTLAPANASVYSATKGAVDTITGSLSKELGARKIRVNAVRPGPVETEGTHTAGFINGDFHDQYVKNAPLGRIGQPQDIAAVTSFLASDDAAWVTGETLLVSGGHR